MSTISDWSIDQVVCQQASGPELLLLLSTLSGRASLQIGGGTASEARALAAELLSVANQLDAHKFESKK